MLNNNYSDIIHYLLKINNIKNDNEKLYSIIQVILEDIDEGNTCTSLNKIAIKVDIQATQVMSLLKKNNLIEVVKNINDIKFDRLLIALDLKEYCLVYINKYLGFELIIAHKIKHLNDSKIKITNLTKYDSILKQLSQLKDAKQNPNEEQYQAIINALSHKFSIITGGPGTGKTSTVILVLWALYELYDFKLDVKICAPTGKASKRVQESMQNNLLELNNNYLVELISSNTNFVTIHKLIGSWPNSSLSKYNQDNQLNCDVLIIDESSMLGVSLFSKLLNAVNMDKIRHIILLGDKNQLSSVEEGAVFSSLIEAIKPVSDDLFSQIENSAVNSLYKSNRNSTSIGHLANGILNNDISLVMKSFNDNIQLLDCTITNIINHTRFNLKNYYQNLNSLLNKSNFSIINDIKQVISCYNQHILLCTNNVTQYGTININKLIDKEMQLIQQSNSIWYHGKPIIITENSATLELFNGDIGICLEYNGLLKVYFENGIGILPVNLPKHNLAYAITIHKSQGSEYNHVSIVLPPNSDMISRELFYTAVTRARVQITVFSNQDTIKKAISNKTNRQSGIKDLISLI